jgi:hypothetical protein
MAPQMDCCDTCPRELSHECLEMISRCWPNCEIFPRCDICERCQKRANHRAASRAATPIRLDDGSPSLPRAPEKILLSSGRPQRLRMNRSPHGNALPAVHAWRPDLLLDQPLGPTRTMTARLPVSFGSFLGEFPIF